MRARVFVCSVLLLAFAGFALGDCQIHELVITFGDAFTSKQDLSSYWVVSFTLRNMDGIEICKPKLNLLNSGEVE